MSNHEKQYIFAGGGTGGHIYPGIAVAEQIRQLDPEAKILFCCSTRPVDSHILTGSGFDFVTLDAKSPSPRPDRLIAFLISLRKCMAKTRKYLTPNTTVIATGGFVSVPVVLAAKKMKLPISLINVDMVPGKANKLLARFADEIYLQFEDTHKFFRHTKARLKTTGCPLRKRFLSPEPERVFEELSLDPNKKTLLITGASSGAKSINEAAGAILDKLNKFADTWQIIHLTGKANLHDVMESYHGARINYSLLDYSENIQNLFAAADLIIGRAGAVSIAEFAAAGKPVICMPYPYHKDNHQYLNAAGLCGSGAAVIVDDTPDTPEKTSRTLLDRLNELMADDNKLNKMKEAANLDKKENAALVIAKHLILESD